MSLSCDICKRPSGSHWDSGYFCLDCYEVRPKLKWVDEMPKEPGWYGWRLHELAPYTMVSVDTKLHWKSLTKEGECEKTPGQWAGPIEMPEYSL